MDRKSIFVIAACFVLLLLWTSVIVPALYPPKPLPRGVTNSTAATPPSLATNNPAPAAAPAETNPAPATRWLPAANETNVQEQLQTVTTAQARYTFTSRGGGLKLIELLDYPEAVASRRGRHTETNRLATLNAQAPVPALSVLDGANPEASGNFTLIPTPAGLRAEKTLTNGLTLVKDFVVSTNYLVTVAVHLENRGAVPLSLPSEEWVVGTATPMSAQDSGMAVGMMWFNGEKTFDVVGASYFSSRGFACMPRTPPAEYRGGESNVVWATAHNQFFAMVAMPQQPADQVVVRKFDLPRPTPDELRQNPQAVRLPEAYVVTLVFPGLTIAPHQTVTRNIAFYAGPKEYQTLVRLSDRFTGLDRIMGFGWFGFCSKPLLLGMNAMHNVLGISYGWAIIAITIIIKLIFWPLTQASTRSMKRMQALQPELKAIQAKYKDDPMKVQKKTMELWKEHKVNPMGGCLPMLLQMPVLFGFFYMIRSAIELRGQPFLWVADLSKPDTLFIIPGLGIPFNLLPLLMVATSVWQAHLTPPSPGADPMQQKIMRYMPLIMLAIFYGLPAGLTLYYTVQSLLSVLQTKLTKTEPAAAVVPAGPLTPPKKKK